MAKFLEIVEIKGREILDSRGNPTVEAEVRVCNSMENKEYKAIAAVPSGASTGKFEAVELRDGDKRYNGLGVLKAVKNINEKIAPVLLGKNAAEQMLIDQTLCELDGTENKKKLGANAILAVSIACARVSARALHMPLYRYLGGAHARKIPIPMMNILNGGAHAANNLDFQEFMIVPVNPCCFREALRIGTEVYHSLKSVLKEQGKCTAVGDEGGFAPEVKDVYEALDLLTQAMEKAGYKPGTDIAIALDVAASEWKSESGVGCYHLPKSNQDYGSAELIELYKELTDRYPIISIEDPLDEEDWEGWKKLTEELGHRVRLVGDDLFVTNVKRLEQGIRRKCGNAILIKMNQIGTVTETMDAVEMAQKAGYSVIFSHRSGETEDTTIADFAVAVNAGRIKTGAPCRSERVAKYNRLLRIEEELNSK